MGVVLGVFGVKDSESEVKIGSCGNGFVAFTKIFRKV